MADPEHPDVVRVFETDDVTLVPILKSILEEAGIPYYVQGDEGIGLFPVGSYGTHSEHHGLMTVIFHVQAPHEEEARQLLHSAKEETVDTAREDDGDEGTDDDA